MSFYLLFKCRFSQTFAYCLSVLNKCSSEPFCAKILFQNVILFQIFVVWPNCKEAS